MTLLIWDWNDRVLSTSPLHPWMFTINIYLFLERAFSSYSPSQLSVASPFISDILTLLTTRQIYWPPSVLLVGAPTARLYWRITLCWKLYRFCCDFYANDDKVVDFQTSAFSASLRLLKCWVLSHTLNYSINRERREMWWPCLLFNSKWRNKPYLCLILVKI